MNDDDSSTSTIHQQIDDQENEGTNHEQSTNRAGIRMPRRRVPHIGRAFGAGSPQDPSYSRRHQSPFGAREQVPSSS
jgi:hypothetical protein